MKLLISLIFITALGETFYLLKKSSFSKNENDEELGKEMAEFGI